MKALDFEKKAYRLDGISAPCIRAFSVSGLTISGNKFTLNSPGPASAELLSLKNCVNETVTNNSTL